MTRFKIEGSYAWYQHQHWYFRVDLVTGGGEVVFRKEPFIDRLSQVQLALVGDLTREMEASIADVINRSVGPIPCDEASMKAVTAGAESILQTWVRGHRRIGRLGS